VTIKTGAPYWQRRRRTMQRDEVKVGEWWWEHSTWHGYWIVTERGSVDVATDMTVAHVWDEPRAKQIVREHNVHQPLVQACEAAMKWIDWETKPVDLPDCVRLLGEAMKAAKGGGK
jgi:hypothetical protein